MEPSAALLEISQQVSVCALCGLSSGRIKSVPGEGPVNAEVMCIGEGPGFYEDREGRPFVGAAGKFLSELLAQAGLKREEVFITNVVKCRPPNNRDPQPDELAACHTYLVRQIETINPQMIVTLGRFSMAVFLPEARISGIHGQARLVQGKIVVPMYHPAAALHQPLLRPTLEKDFANLKDTLRRAREASQARLAAEAPVEKKELPDQEKKSNGYDPKQMKLF
ncbi:MAG: uracil-DNA glycosylase family protein [Anaerolineaceae bacterium]